MSLATVVKVLVVRDAFLDKLIADHMGLVRSIAIQVWRRVPSSIERDELISLGNEGLVKAAMRWYAYCEENGYDPRRVEFFKPYADRRIRGTIMDELRKSDWVPRSTRDKIKTLIEAGHEQGVTHAELARKTGMTTAEVHSTLSELAKRPVSLDSEGVEHGAVEDNDGANHMLEHFVLVIRELPEPQQVVLALHYFVGVELQEVARRLGITESRASHLHTEAVLAVHERLEAYVRSA